MYNIDIDIDIDVCRHRHVHRCNSICAYELIVKHKGIFSEDLEEECV